MPNHKTKILDLVFCDAELIDIKLCTDLIRDVDESLPPLFVSIDISIPESAIRAYAPK